jgi:hypothetical protein
MDMVYVLITAGAAVLAVIVAVGVKMWKRQRDYAALKDLVHGATDVYTFLIDSKHRVRETNFYELNEASADDQPDVLGNVIHCQSACDSGLCGTGIACQECPIRLVIKNAFKLKRDFDGIVATMQLYDADHQLKETNVIVDGKLVYIGKEPHLLITLKS